MDEEKTRDIAVGVVLKIDEHLRRNADNGDVKFEEVCDFVNTTDRKTLARILRDDPNALDEVADLLGSESNVSQDVFFAMREMCGGIETIGTDPEKRAEVDALLTILGDITDIEEPPPISDLSGTEIVVDEVAARYTASSVSEWLSDTDSQCFYSAWGSVPSLYEQDLRQLTAITEPSELVFGASVMEIISERLVNTHSASVPSPTVRHWLNSIAQTNSVSIYEAKQDVPGTLLIFDNYVVAGYFAREESPTGAFLATDDSAFREWALEVYRDWRKRSRELDIPIRFRGENPYFEREDATSRN